MNLLNCFKQVRTALMLALMLCLSIGVYAQAPLRTLTGVVDDSSGETLIGANIRIEGEQRGVTTDIDGKYSIEVRPGEKLIFSYLGYKDYRVEYTGQPTLNVTLQEDQTGLDEVVVVGYGVQRKRDVTGSISSVKSQAIATTVAAANPMQALQGKIAGVQVIDNAAPGGLPTVRVRGVSSFRNSNPVYVVDGLIMDDIAFLNASEVESMEVLKDASSTAIYGSRGANGVIIVTTKQGRKNQRLSVNVDANVSVSQLAKYLPYANASQFMVLKNMNQQALNAANGTNNPLPYTDDQINAAGKGTDWQKEITRLAITQNYNVNMVGGTERATYGLNAGYFDQQGVMKGSGYKRANVKISNTYELTKWFTLGSNISFIYERRNSQGSSLSSALRALPTAPIMDPDNPDQFFGPVDEIGKSGNPVASLYYNSDNYTNYYKTLANFFIDVELVKNLRLRSTFTLNNTNSEYKAFYPEFYVNVDQKRTENTLNISQSRTLNWLNENTLSYSFDKRQHHLDAVVGVTFQQNNSQSQNQNIEGMPSTAWKNRNLWYTGLGDASTLTGGSGGSVFTYLSYLARANYSFANKYMVTATVRVDGSSRFPEDGRYGTFPALGVGWAMKEENWLKDVNWLTQLKLRASYGVVGSDAGIPDNIQTVYVNRVNGVFGKDPENITTSEAIDMTIDYGLHWEEARQFNIGFDFAAFRSRLGLEFDYYNKTTADILTTVTMPGVSGSSYAPLSNVATARNSGVEWNLTWNDKQGNFSYHAGLVGTTLKNEVISVNQDLPPLENGVNRTLVGYPIGGFWGYEVIGIYQDAQTVNQTPHIDGAMAGDLWYKDQNGDGSIDSEDRIYMGSYLPKVTLGFNFGFEWKGLEFSMDWYAAMGHKIYSLRRQTLGTPNYNVSWEDFKNAWTGPGTTNEYTRVLLDGTGTNNNSSEYFLENGSYLKLHNVMIAYNLPQTAVQKIHLRSLKFYIAGNNLFYLTKATGYTPEVGGGPNAGGRDDYDNYPGSRMFSFGLNIGL